LLEHGLSFHKAGRLADAEAVYQQILKTSPSHFGALHSLGIIHYQRGNYEDAIHQIDLALRTSPHVAEAHGNRGDALMRLKHFEEALASFDRAVALKPDYAEAFSNRGVALAELKRLDEALASFDRAVALKPNFAEAFNNRGNALKAQGKLDEAVAQFQRALALKPDYAEAHNSLGAAFQALGKLDEAVAQFQRALALKPDLVAAHDNLLFCLTYNERLSAEQLFAAHQEWDIRYGRVIQRPSAYSNNRSAGRRLKVGYVSGDFRQHPVAWFCRPLLAAHDRGAVEIFCYAEIKRPDDVTDRFNFQLPTIFTPTMAPNSISVRRDSPRHMTVFPGGGSLARAR